MGGRWEGPTLRALEHGCNTCGARGEVFYYVSFYILPMKLLRKRHRERAQNAIYCRSCYETHSELPILIDGESASIPMTPRIEPQQMGCTVCGRRLVDTYEHRELYGLITSSLWMYRSIVESQCLAIFCGQCVESHRISLVGKICEATP